MAQSLEEIKKAHEDLGKALEERKAEFDDQHDKMMQAHAEIGQSLEKYEDGEDKKGEEELSDEEKEARAEEEKRAEEERKAEKSADKREALDITKLIKSAVSEGMRPAIRRIESLEKKLDEPSGRKSVVSHEAEEKLKKSLDKDRDFAKEISAAPDFKTAFKLNQERNVSEMLNRAQN